MDAERLRASLAKSQYMGDEAIFFLYSLDDSTLMEWYSVSSNHNYNYSLYEYVWNHYPKYTTNSHLNTILGNIQLIAQRLDK